MLLISHYYSRVVTNIVCSRTIVTIMLGVRIVNDEHSEHWYLSIKHCFFSYYLPVMRTLVTVCKVATSGLVTSNVLSYVTIQLFHGIVTHPGVYCCSNQCCRLVTIICVS